MRGLVVPEPTEDFTADPVELFFDLAFVYAFSQLVYHLVHDPTWGGAGEALLLFLVLWLAWSTFTWAANAVSGNGRGVRAIFLVATAASVPMGASVTTAFGSGGPTFAIGASIILLMGIGTQLWGLSSTGKASSEFRTVVRYSLPNAVSMIVLITGGFLDEGPRKALWLLFILIVLGGIIAARAGDWIVRPGHFAERHGLIVIIALGEIVVAIGIAVVQALSETDGLPNETFAGLTAAGILAGLLWWSYFDRLNPALEHRGEDLSGRQRAHFVADVYTGLHVFIVSGIIAIAAAAEEILLHPRDPVPTEFLVMFVGGFALFSLGVALAAGRAYKIIAKERIATVLVVGALAWIGRSWDGVALLFAVDVALILMIVAEHVRIEGPSAAEPVNASA